MHNWTRINNFQFHKGDIGGIWEALRSSAKGSAEDALCWETISIPHCFNSLDALDPDNYYYQGPGWYKTKININNPYKRGQTFIYFEGAGQTCDVYLDDELIANHVGGYDEWKVDISLNLKKDKSFYNLIIRCDNSKNLERIPSDLADFNIYGGLYRNVHLVYEAEVYLEEIHLDPIFNENDGTGNLTIKGRINKEIDSLNINIIIVNELNTLIYKEKRNINKRNFSAEIQLINISPWSTKNPNLYKCVIELEFNNKVFSKSESFGFRSFVFKTHGPFFLNGEKLLLKGTHRHEDHAGFGAAQPISSIIEEMHLIKDMGVNFIRLGHYQQNREVLNLCDKLGILVWEEIPWCRGGLGGKDYQLMGKRMLKNMINQHYNHPSVIIWGLGNENDWPGDFSTFNEEEIRVYMKELNTIAHNLDNTRKTAIRRCDFAKDIVDVYSPSIWAGWYRGHYREYKESTLKHISEVDHFLHVEWGADTHPNRFSEDPYLGLENLKTGIGTDERGNDASLYGGIDRVSKDGNYSENYACDLFDWTLKEQLDIPNLTGTAFWTFKDFSTPLRRENPIPFVNQKGAVQRDLTKKEVYFVIQSYWSDNPMVRIFGHNWKIRWGDEFENKEFRVYSNCISAKLIVDGIELGKKDRNSKNFPSQGLRWNTPLEMGNHNVRAIAYFENEILEDSYDFYYTCQKWGDPFVMKSKFIKDNNNQLLWEIEVLDSKNNVCLDCEKKVKFSAAGISPFITNMGTYNGSKVIECSNGRANIAIKNTNKPAIICAYIEGLPLCSAIYNPKKSIINNYD